MTARCTSFHKHQIFFSHSFRYWTHEWRGTWDEHFEKVVSILKLLRNSERRSSALQITVTEKNSISWLSESEISKISTVVFKGCASIPVVLRVNVRGFIRIKVNFISMPLKASVKTLKSDKSLLWCCWSYVTPHTTSPRGTAPQSGNNSARSVRWGKWVPLSWRFEELQRRRRHNNRGTFKHTQPPAAGPLRQHEETETSGFISELIMHIIICQTCRDMSLRATFGKSLKIQNTNSVIIIYLHLHLCISACFYYKSNS